jgi:hypothetical protein
MMPVVRRPQRHGLPVALSLMLAAAALAVQEAPGSATAPLYAVEILVFRHLAQSGTPETPPPAGVLPPAATESTSGLATPDNAGYTSLPATAMQLSGAAGQMRRSGRYRLLLHTGWIQPAHSQAAAVPTALPPTAGPDLRGDITLFRERYLHVVVNLELGDEASVSTPQRIRQSRRLRGRAWQYFDHPEFGAIVAVRALAAAAINSPDTLTESRSPAD